MRAIKISETEFLNPDAVEFWQTSSRAIEGEEKLEDAGYDLKKVVAVPPRTESVLFMRTRSGQEITLTGWPAEQALALLSS